MINTEINKNQFIDICKKNIHRDNIEKLIDWLCSTDFFIAPASSHYHLSEYGGLCQHSLNVYNHLIRDIKQLWYPDSEIPDNILEQASIIALFHDFVKINFYDESYRNVKNDKGEWIKVPTYIINNKSELYGHGIKSARIVSKFIDLTDEEFMAITYHMGFSDNGADTSVISDLYNHNTMAVLLNIADMKATFMDERK